MDYYFYKHSLTYQYVLEELNNKMLTIYNQNTSNYPEFVNNTYESEKLYGDYDEWEDYIDNIYN